MLCRNRIMLGNRMDRTYFLSSPTVILAIPTAVRCAAKEVAVVKRRDNTFNEYADFILTR